MSKKSEEEIEQKLRALEAAMKEEESSKVPSTAHKSTELSQHSVTVSSAPLSKEQEGTAMKADLHLLGGFTSLLVGLLVLFSNLQVSTGWGWGLGSLFSGGGGNGTGLLVLMVIVGMGFFFYDYKNKIGWFLIIIGLAALLLSLFATMQIHLYSMNLLSFLFIFIPIAIGGGLLAKGMKMHGQIQDQSKKS